MADLSDIATWCKDGCLPDQSAIYSVLTDENDNFISLEGPTWDFKFEWPFSMSDGYFGGIARLVCAFANSLGGIIVFGVHDTKRTGGHNKVIVNIDRFLKAFQQLTDREIDYDFAHCISEKFGDIDVLLITPRLYCTAPIRFKVKIDKYAASTIWIRAGHEVLPASPPHFPLLFCRSVSFEAVRERDGSIPPSPATMKRFIGRVEVLDKLFTWLESSDEPRNYLHGKGGSGKTTIAHEFARLVKDYGEFLRIEGKNQIDIVIFLSAKEKYLVPATGAIEHFDEADFSDEPSLLRQILFYGGWSNDRKYIDGRDLNELRNDVIEFFSIYSALLVIDDVDTLTTKGVDPGADFLYRVMCRSKKSSKILYTLRNAPSQSLHSSIDVPKLEGDEYNLFVSECAQQYSVKEPSKSFRDGPLAELSERRPLVIENIVALSRTAGSYERAGELFAQHAGDDLREYVFGREWDALAGDPMPRLLLAALAELNRGATFVELETILEADGSRVKDALGSLREMFLQVEEVGIEAVFSLAPLTRHFVNSRKGSLAGYSTIKARVQTFKQNVRVTSPTIAIILSKITRLLPYRVSDHDDESLLEALKIVQDPTLLPSTTEDPIFRSCSGYVFALQKPPKLTEARSSFEYAFRMRYEPKIAELRAWFNAEKGSGSHDGWCERIADSVIEGRLYSELDKISMLSRKATAIYQSARERMFTDPVDAKSKMGKSLSLHLRAFRLNCIRRDIYAEVSEGYGRNTARQWFSFSIASSEPWDIFDQVRELVATKDVYLDPIEIPFCQALHLLNRIPIRSDNGNRFKNKLKGLVDQLSGRDLWLDTVKSSNTRDAIREFSSNLERKIAELRMINTPGNMR